MKAKMYQSHNGLIYRANGDEIQVLNPQVNNEWRASVLMMETAKKSDRPLQEILDRKAALNGWQPWEEPEESERTGSVSWEKAEPIPARTSFEEQQVIEVERAVPQGLSIQQVSDEMERLSQRYGRGMEEWLYDQSAL